MQSEISTILKTYAAEMRKQLRSNAAASEPALAPQFQRLVEHLIPYLGPVPAMTVSPEYTKPGVGRPDIALIKPGQPARAFIELKAPSKPADPKQWKVKHDKKQYERLKELAHWAACNFCEFQLFERDRLVGRSTILPPKAIDPAMSDAAADSLIDGHDPARFLELLAHLFRAQPPTATSDVQLAELLAHSARIVKSAVEERLGELDPEADKNDPLMLVRRTYRNVLYAHPEAGGYASSDFDALFSSAFAQTLAFGLLLVREHLASTEVEKDKQLVDAEAWRHMPNEHPLMKGTMEAISDERVINSVGIGFEVMIDTVNCFDPKILAPRKDGSDPIITFYEFFLSVFDPAARERYGVYYTPIQVVRFMVGALDRVLRDDLGTNGLRDENVTILDPATGTGTYLLGIAERVRDRVMEEEGGPAASMALKSLASRMFGFEMLIGPYAVAHYRLHHALSHRPPDDGEDEPQLIQLPRLGVYLTDTLSRPDAVTPIGNLGMAGIPIDEERARANEIKAREQILAIIGNPPYRRLKKGENETLVGRWMDEKWADLKKPVSDAGWGNQLNTFPELSVAFWRWSIWKLFEAENAPQKGVIVFISNRKFLTGKPYAGLRKKLRENFSRIEILDLRGDGRTGARASISNDQNVFDIRVGVCITIAVADGKDSGGPAEIRYCDAWDSGRTSRQSKLEWLNTTEQLFDWKLVERGPLDDFRPTAFPDFEGLSLEDCFVFCAGGAQTARDDLVYAVERQGVSQNILNFLSASDDEAKKKFKSGSATKYNSARKASFDASFIRKIAFRPLDFRYLYGDERFVEYIRTELSAAWSSENRCIYAMPFGTGGGTAVWLHSIYPDYQALSERGGYAFPLYDRRRGPDAHNINPEILTALAEAYGQTISPEDFFDAILALLSATSYSVRFAEDLEDTFPHIPFPAHPGLFHRAVAIGREIRAVESFAREPGGAFKLKDFCRLRSEATGPIGLVTGDAGEWFFCADGTGKFDGLPERVWEFAVSGYRVLKRWADAREGLDGPTYWPQFRDVAARIHELLHWFDQADLVLAEVLEDTLSREELGLVAPVTEAEDD